ncbi:aminopeptidase [Coprothermobacter platensis]|uniref:aminopeptidase n=1 Tax=Coprothermobacter platensis TaxID=108819 RepID=UPI00058C67B8|nr:aminopeptidase [Coprothermobacter platensis]
MEDLMLNWKNGHLRVDETTSQQIDAFAKDYMRFMVAAKTERESITESLRIAKENGFVDIEEIKEWKPGQKVYYVNRKKSAVFAILGQRPALDGVNMVAAHADAPRLDLKPRPLKEDEQIAILETHYYGGIKNFHWVSTPLSLHGVVVKSDGTVVQVSIGEKDDDPVLVIPDILPHLGRKIQMSKTMDEAIPGESLDVVIGSLPMKGEEKEPVKKYILQLLNDTYGITEADLLSAELEVVPALKPKEVGLDRALIGAYAQDDRVCGYTAFRALLDMTFVPEKTAMVIFADKEEVGSMGNTGMQSAFIDNFFSKLIALSKPSFTPLDLFEAWNKTKVLSADVTAAVDPIWKSVHEMQNAARVHYGPVLTKYTGSRGKGGANDAHAEFLAQVRDAFDKENVVWQMAELGKVDEGGGGTVALFMANRGADVVDIGVALWGMHSPFEISSKLDVYYAYKADEAFFKHVK